MSIRAVILGLLGGAFIAAFCFINDGYVGTDVLVGHHLPICVFGMVALVGMLINPLLYKVRRFLAAGHGESWRRHDPDAGGLRRAGHVVRAELRTDAGDARPAQHGQPGLAEAAGPQLHCPPACCRPGGSTTRRWWGASSRATTTPLASPTCPGRSGEGPLETWMPLAVLLAVATICLSLVVHRQWSDHERLRYPIAEVAGALTAQEQGKAVGPLFRQQSFWIAFAIILIVPRVRGDLHLADRCTGSSAAAELSARCWRSSPP